MRIEIVKLENIRSHVDSAVPFSRGFNCLVGGLGCGKSSVLYSIDFALFGEPIGRSFDYLLREGASTGKVTVEFFQSGKSYRICRGLRRRGKGMGQDFDELKLFEGETLLAGGKSEAVTEQLKAITGLDRELFREVVWIRQEHLKELLNVQPRERQKRLDELFGLSDYETAWTNLAGYGREYEGERRAYEKDADVAGMERLAKEYDRTAQEFSFVEVELQDLTRRLAAAKRAMEEADLKLRQLEETRARNEELKRKEAKTVADLTNVQEALAALTQKLGGRKSVVESLEQRLDTMGAQAESFRADLRKLGIPADQPVEALRRHIATFDDQISSLRGQQEAALKNMQADTRRISSLSEESRCPLCLQQLDESYKDGLLRRLQDENNARRSTLGQLKHDLDELEHVKSKASAAFSSWQNLVPRIEDLRARIEEETDALAELSREFEGKRGLEEELHARLDAVRLEVSRFDVSELEIAKARSREAFQQYSSLESALGNGENNKRVLAERLQGMKERIDQAQEKIERMQKIVKVVGVIGDMRDAYRGIQPKLRSEFVKVLRNFVQQVLDGLAGREGSFLNVMIDETYTPCVLSEGGVEREVSNLSGGERTLLAFAYRLGLGQLIMQSKTGHGLSMLLLDEPTESLGTEDGSIDRLAEAISRFKAIEQTIAVTHSDAFAEKAEHVIRIEKEADVSKVSVEKPRI